MKAKDLTQADVGKWVSPRAQYGGTIDGRIYVRYAGDYPEGIFRETILPEGLYLEFTDPPSPVQEVGDVFFSKIDEYQWEIAAISEAAKACLMVRVSAMNDIVAANYPLNPDRWTLARKGTNP